MLRPNLEYGVGRQPLQEHPSLNFGLDDIAIHCIAEVGMGRKHCNTVLRLARSHKMNIGLRGTLGHGSYRSPQVHRSFGFDAGVHCGLLQPPKRGIHNMASVLITGTSTGIGLATALALGRAGDNVYATMRNPSRAPELGAIVAKEGLPVKVSVMDVDSDSSVKIAIANIYKQAGQIDVLVNNAGVERNGSIEELPLSEFRAVMETNYFGPLRCIQAVVAQMRQRKSGCIINVASVAGHIATSPLAPYTASKFALEALSEALAQEMKMFNVRVAIVEPGIIETPMSKSIGEPSNASPYPQQRRFAHLFTAALKNPAPP